MKTGKLALEAKQMIVRHNATCLLDKALGLPRGSTQAEQEKAGKELAEKLKSMSQEERTATFEGMGFNFAPKPTK